ILNSLDELNDFGTEENHEIEFGLSNFTYNLYANDIEQPTNEMVENFLTEIMEKLKEKCSYLKDIQIIFRSKLQEVFIINNLGNFVRDYRTFFLIRITVLASKNSNSNTFFKSLVSRFSFEDLSKRIDSSIEELLKMIEIMIDAKDSIKGSLPVLFGAGNPGVLIHEAVGHSLEADFHRLETSVFSGMIDKVIASKGVNIIDDGSIPSMNGSIHFDDEGVQTKRNILVENGILKTPILDRKNAFLMKRKSTGNGRQQNYKTPVIPRMTNTFLEPYNESYASSFEDMCSVFNKFLFVKSVSHGAVDISSGNFSFTADSSFLVENGNHTPLKEAVFSGRGADVMTNIVKIGKNLDLTPGTCGKNGSWVPVTSGQTDVLVSEITTG
ncbi:MAG: TldD/PmbA family protein, partial [Bacteroidota bacterium]